MSLLSYEAIGCLECDATTRDAEEQQVIETYFVTHPQEGRDSNADKKTTY